MTLSKLYPTLSAAEKAAICKKVGISRAYLSQLANGERKNPSYAKLRALVRADKRLKLAELVAEFAAAESAKQEA